MAITARPMAAASQPWPPSPDGGGAGAGVAVGVVVGAAKEVVSAAGGTTGIELGDGLAGMAFGLALGPEAACVGLAVGAGLGGAEWRAAGLGVLLGRTITGVALAAGVVALGVGFGEGVTRSLGASLGPTCRGLGVAPGGRLKGVSLPIACAHAGVVPAAASAIAIPNMPRPMRASLAPVARGASRGIGRALAKGRPRARQGLAKGRLVLAPR
jgi:hypothetical protein